MKTDKQKIIIAFIIFLFIVSTTHLFQINDRGLDLNSNKNWWSVYFENPKGPNIDFVVENYSNNFNFHCDVFNEKDKIYEESFVLKKGAIHKINLDKKIINNQNKKLIIRISDGKNTQEIYKNF